MKTKYECETCGFQSENEKEVQKCEDQGKPEHRFFPKQIVEYLFYYDGTDKRVKAWVKAIIVMVEFEKRTHKLSYVLSLDDESLPPHLKGYFQGWVPEEKIRPISKSLFITPVK